MSRDRGREMSFSYLIFMFGFAEHLCSCEERRGEGREGQT